MTRPTSDGQTMQAQKLHFYLFSSMNLSFFLTKIFQVTKISAGVICIKQVAGHVMWPKAAWLYHGATILMTLSFLVSGGLVSKLNNGYQKFMFYDNFV